MRYDGVRCGAGYYLHTEIDKHIGGKRASGGTWRADNGPVRYAGVLGPHALAPHAGVVCWPRVLALYRSPGHVQALDRRCR